MNTVNNYLKANLTGWTKVSEMTLDTAVSAEYTKDKLQFSYVLSSGTAKKPTTGTTYSVAQKL